MLILKGLVALVVILGTLWGLGYGMWQAHYHFKHWQTHHETKTPKYDPRKMADLGAALAIGIMGVIGLAIITMLLVGLGELFDIIVELLEGAQ